MSKKSYLSGLDNKHDNVPHKIHQRDFTFPTTVEQEKKSRSAEDENNDETKKRDARIHTIQRLLGIISWCAETYPSVAYPRGVLASRTTLGEQKVITSCSRIIKVLRRGGFPG